MPTLGLQIPKRMHSELIGRGGSVIKGMQDKHGVSIDIPQRDDPSCTVVLTGSDDGVGGALTEMEDTLGFRPSEDPLNTVEYNIDSSLYGRIIGHQGQTLRDLQRECRCSIEIPSRGADSSSCVKAQGRADGIRELTSKLSALLHETPQIVSSTAVDVPVEEAIDLHTSSPIAEALFFPESDASNAGFDRFLHYLRSATTTLDICVFTITDNRIRRAILHAHHSGVKVRIITDDECASARGSDIAMLREAGVQVRMDNDPAHMHHKSALRTTICCRMDLHAAALWLVQVVSVLAISLGGVVPFVFQYINIRKTRSSKGFSTYVILELIAAYVLRICFWFGHPFEIPLLVQSVTMIVGLMFLQHACITYDAQHLSTSSSFHFDGTIDLKTFWRWAHFKDYIVAVLLFTAVAGALTLLLIDVPVFIETEGLISLLLEASLGLPQFVNNFRNKSTEGMSVIMVCCWLSGDVFKTTYFVLRSAPMQFFVCGLLQICVDISILVQVFIYARRSAPRATTKVITSPARHLAAV